MAKSKKQNKQQSSGKQLLTEGEKLQQRASSKKGDEAINLYKMALEKYSQSLLKGGLSTQQVQDIHAFSGECYNGQAETVLDMCSNLPSNELTLTKEKEAQAMACQLFEQAVKCYIEAGDREDAVLGCGNAFAAWGENVEDVRHAEQLFNQALTMYKKVEGMEEDVDTLCNYADVCMLKGQLLCENGEIERGMLSFREGDDVYNRACQQCDSYKGDDLPALLCNWGNGTINMADNIQDKEQAISVYDEAIQRLKACIEFVRADVDPLISLGNALSSKARVTGSQEFYKEAIQKGYQEALNIRNTEIEAIVGIGESLFELAKLNSSDEVKQSYLKQSLERFEYAMFNIDKMQGFEERCDVRYNCACVLVAMQRTREAEDILVWLLQNGGTTKQEIFEDQDLASVHQSQFLKE